MSRETFRRWVPLISVAVLIVSTVLHLVGHGEAAKALDGVAALTGLHDSSPIPLQEIAAPLAALVAALGGAWGLALKVLALYRKARAGQAVANPSRLAGLVLLIFLPSLLLGGCFRGSAGAQVRFGAEPVGHPDEVVVRGYVCRGLEGEAVRYLSLPEYSWMGQAARERYLADAHDRRIRGECPCPTPGCPAQPQNQK